MKWMDEIINIIIIIIIIIIVIIIIIIIINNNNSIISRSLDLWKIICYFFLMLD